MHCMKCKKQTESIQVQEIFTKNNRRRLSALCKVCGSKKSKFTPNKTGQGIFNNILSTAGNTIAEMHLPANQPEYVPGGSFNSQENYSYCGLGTKHKQRNKEGYKGINELDKMCKLHDEFYPNN